MVTTWGVGRRRETAGVVVDLCAGCATLQPHWLCHYYVGLQIHYVNVDDGMYADSAIVCYRCSRETEIQRSRYSGIIAVDEAVDTPLNEGLARTNESLARALHAVADARGSGAEGDVLEQAEALLFDKCDLGELVNQLGNWNDLNPSDRASASAELRELWLTVGSPARPTTPVQPGMPGWFTPARKPSVVRAIDYRVVVVAFTIVGFIVAIVAIFE